MCKNFIFQITNIEARFMGGHCSSVPFQNYKIRIFYVSVKFDVGKK